jgi:O-antigen ligase
MHSIHKNKIPFVNIMNKNDNALAFICMMLIGFVFSRALLSMGMGLFVVNSLWKCDYKTLMANLWVRISFLLGMLFLISICWSTDRTYFWEHLQVKVPLYFLPIAFVTAPRFTAQQLKTLIGVSLLVSLVAASYSFYFFFTETAYYIEQYRFAHSLPTLAYGNYIQLSLLVVFICFFTLINVRLFEHKITKGLIALALLLLLVFIHVVASKVALLALYIGFLIYAVHLGFKLNWRYFFTLLLAFIACFAIAYNTIGTFKNKIGYLYYSALQFTHADSYEKLDPNYSDIGRLISYRVAVQEIKKAPIFGFGEGDVMQTMKNGYHHTFPQVSEEKILLPHNQFLITLLSIGCVGLILFLWYILIPIWAIYKQSPFIALLFAAIQLLGLLVEPALEIQSGVFVFIFCTGIIYQQYRNK